MLLEGPLPAAPLAPDEDLWRERLHRRLQAEPEAPERTNLLLALLPLFPPGVLRIPAALQQVPGWLLGDYARHCEPALLEQLRQPVGLLESSGGSPGGGTPVEEPKSSTAITSSGSEGPTRPLPRLSPKSNQEALAYFRSEATVNRMAALLNLFALDPSDADTLEELAGLRRIIGQLWLNVEEDSLESLYRSPVGSVYRSLLASDFGAAPLSEADQAVRQELAQWVGDLRAPGALNALLAILPFFPKGKVSLAGGADVLPGWLQAELNAYQKS